MGRAVPLGGPCRGLVDAILRLGGGVPRRGGGFGRGRLCSEDLRGGAGLVADRLFCVDRRLGIAFVCGRDLIGHGVVRGSQSGVLVALAFARLPARGRGVGIDGFDADRGERGRHLGIEGGAAASTLSTVAGPAGIGLALGVCLLAGAFQGGGAFVGVR